MTETKREANARNALASTGPRSPEGKAKSARNATRHGILSGEVLLPDDSKAAFVETQTARNDAEHSYSYAFLSSPLPVSNYKSTIKVTAKADGSSTVIWSGSYTPDEGKEKAASEALNGVYEAGLAEIKAKLAK